MGDPLGILGLTGLRETGRERPGRLHITRTELLCF